MYFPCFCLWTNPKLALRMVVENICDKHTTRKHNSVIEIWPKTGTFPVGNYLFKVNNRNTRTRCEICSKLTIKICRLGWNSSEFLYQYLIWYWSQLQFNTMFSKTTLCMIFHTLWRFMPTGENSLAFLVQVNKIKNKEKQIHLPNLIAPP